MLECFPSAEDIGDCQIKVVIRNGYHENNDGFDDQAVVNYAIAKPEPKPNRPPRLLRVNSDLKSPQNTGISITWTAVASDPDEDTIYYKFSLKSPAKQDTWEDISGWTTENRWIWLTDLSNVGHNKIKIEVRDGFHAGPESNDAEIIMGYTILAVKSK